MHHHGPTSTYASAVAASRASSSPVELVCARLAAVAGLLVFMSAPLWALNEHQLIIKDSAMWLKTLGLLCAGVFVGAALVEAKQMLRKRKRSDRDAGEQDGADDDQDVRRP